MISKLKIIAMASIALIKGAQASSRIEDSSEITLPSGATTSCVTCKKCYYTHQKLINDFNEINKTKKNYLELCKKILITPQEVALESNRRYQNYVSNAERELIERSEKIIGQINAQWAGRGKAFFSSGRDAAINSAIAPLLQFRDPQKQHERRTFFYNEVHKEMLQDNNRALDTVKNYNAMQAQINAEILNMNTAQIEHTRVSHPERYAKFMENKATS